MRCSRAEWIRCSQRSARNGSAICSTMDDISFDHHRYRLVAVERDGQWVAHAERADSGEPFGIECVAATEAGAIARLRRWLEWQAEHAAALQALQQAERTYHRTIAGSAFANPTEGPTAI